MIDLAALSALPDVTLAEQNAFLWRLIFAPQRGQSASSERFDQLSAQLTSHLTATQTALIQELRTMSDALRNELAQLQADVAANKTVIGSAVVAFQGLAAKLAATEAAVKEAGATDEIQAIVAAARQELEASTSGLAAAIQQNTDAAPSDTGTTIATDANATDAAA